VINITYLFIKLTKIISNCF